MKKRPSRPSRRANAPNSSSRPARAASPRAAGASQVPTPMVAELRALRLEVERTAGHVRDALQKIERLALAVGDLQHAMAELQASLGEGEVEYGAVDEGDSEVGEGHA